MRRDRQFGLASTLQQLKSLPPTGNDILQTKAGGMSSLVGTVEHPAIGKSALVVNLNSIVRRRPRARTWFGQEEDEPCLGANRSRFGSSLFENGLLVRIAAWICAC